MKTAKKFFFLAVIAAPAFVNAQCTLTDAACTGTAITDAGTPGTANPLVIPSGTTYKIVAGVTYTHDIEFTDNTSKLCIEGTWTGKVNGGAACSSGGQIDNYGTISSTADWSFSFGTLILNNHVGGTVTIKSFTTSGGTFTITNCWNMTFSSAGTGVSSSGGTFTINNYASINITGSITSSNGSFTFNNKPGSQMYVGVNFSLSDGTFINDAKMCVTSSTSFSAGTFTNNDCFRTTTFNISGTGAFRNNNYLQVNGNFSNSGTDNSNNGTLVITGNYSNSGTFGFGAGSLTTSVNWTNSGTIDGPGSGCAQIRATGTTGNSGTFTSATSGRIYFYDSGTPAGGLDSNSGTLNSLNVNNNTCTPTSYPACTMAGSACTTVLPIVLTEFRADCKNNKMELTWTTASELNNDFFTIERTKDGITFDAVGTVDSKAPYGNSNTLIFYSFTDNSFPKEESSVNALFYYRLKQTDFDGNYTYSDIRSASCASYCIGDITVTSDRHDLLLTIPSICATLIDLTIYNTLGQIVSTKREYIVAGNNIIQLHANDVAQGLYILRASTINQTVQKKFGKQ